MSAATRNMVLVLQAAAYLVSTPLAGTAGAYKSSVALVFTYAASGHYYSNLTEALGDFCGGPSKVTLVYGDVSVLVRESLLQLLHHAGCPVNVAIPSTASAADPIIKEIPTWMRDGQQWYKILLLNASHDVITGLLQPLPESPSEIMAQILQN